MIKNLNPLKINIAKHSFPMNGRYPDDTEMQQYINKIKSDSTNESVTIAMETTETTL